MQILNDYTLIDNLKHAGLLHSQGKAVFKYAKPKHIFIYNLRSR